VLESRNAEFVALGLTNLGPHSNQHDILVQGTLFSCFNHHNDKMLSSSTSNNVTKIYEPKNAAYNFRDRFPQLFGSLPVLLEPQFELFFSS
jgi:hypothetical protein